MWCLKSKEVPFPVRCSILIFAKQVKKKKKGKEKKSLKTQLLTLSSNLPSKAKGRLATTDFEVLPKNPLQAPEVIPRDQFQMHSEQWWWLWSQNRASQSDVLWKDRARGSQVLDSWHVNIIGILELLDSKGPSRMSHCSSHSTWNLIHSLQ